MRASTLQQSGQSGAILVTALIMLVLLTLIGVTAMGTANMEERMAGNVRDRNLAFQAAESALRAGEDYLRSNALSESNFNDDPTSSTASSNPGLVAQIKPTSTRTTDEPGKASYWRSFNWTTHSRQYGSDITNTYERPRYAIEVLGSVPLESQQGGGAKPEANVYRITARGVGISGASIVFLQSTYIKQ